MIACFDDRGNDLTVNSDETERVDRGRGRGNGQLHVGKGPLHSDQWTPVQNPRRAWKKGNRVIKMD
jgi:hypothetical protein